MTVILEERRAAVEHGSLRLTGEDRQQEFAAELRASSTTVGDKTFLNLRGYASTVDQPYRMYDMFGEYEEVISRAAFDKTLASNPDVNFLVNHTGLAMARTTNGTLKLSVDAEGLLSEAELNPLRNDVHDLEIAIRDKNVDQMSFAFRIVNGDWNKDYTTFTITEVDLNRGDVSAVNYGANPNTSISARAKQAFEAVEQLRGEPLRILAERVNARLVREGEPAAVVSEPGPNKATLLARIEGEDD